MKQTLKTVFGLALIAAGVIGILVFSGVINLSFSIDGWWTLFIIIPCIGSLFTGKDIVGSLMGIGVGVLLLLAARGVIDWNKIWMYLIAFLAIGIGVKLVFNLGCKGCSAGFKDMKSTIVDGKEIRHIENSFGQQKISFTGEKVEGLKVANNFGATCLDLRGAIIDSDIDIKVEVAFGGLEIYIPEGYVVKTAVSSGFGGVSDKRMSQADPTKPVIFITGNCGFGGIALR